MTPTRRWRDVNREKMNGPNDTEAFVNDSRACGSCKFFALSTDDDDVPDGIGQCRRGRPVHMETGGSIIPMKWAKHRAIWPLTHASDWCGEYHPLQSTR